MSNALLCSGDLYLDRLSAAGASTGYNLVSNATKLAISESSEVKTLKSRMRASYGQALATVALKNPAAISLTLNEIDREKLALALLGDVADLSQTAASITDEAVTAIKDKWVELAGSNIAEAGVVVEDETDTTTYVEGTDYQLNRELGLIMALSTGNIGDGDVLHVDYDKQLVSGHRISGSVNSRIAVKLKLDGENLVDGSHVIVTVDKAILTPDGEVDFLSEDFTELSLSGELETLAGQSAPYRIDLIESSVY